MSDKQSAIINKYKGFGFSEDAIKRALQKCKNPDNQNAMLDTLIEMNKESSGAGKDSMSSSRYTTQGFGEHEFEENRVILESLQTAGNLPYVFIETMNVVERKRASGTPVGLKNIGNTCYFNSLLQTYFVNYLFFKQIITFVEPKTLTLKEGSLQEKDRIKASIRLVKHLQRLFATLTVSDKKYADPTAVLNSIVDDTGKYIPIGDQKDVGEFNLFFLARIEEGLQQQEKYQKELENSKKEEIAEEGSMLAKPVYTKNIPEAESRSSAASQQSLSYSPFKESQVRRSLSVNVVNKEALISNLYFGKAKQTIMFERGPEKKKCEQVEVEIFNMIILDIHYKELYSSWDAANFCVIEDYQTDLGETTLARKKNCITSAPSTLFFQLQRVQYDKDKGKSVKINSEFRFEKEIYIDRFLEENQEEYLKVREKVVFLKNRANEFEKALDALKNYKTSSLDIGSILSHANEFLAHQNKANMKENLLENPIYFDGANKKEIDVALKVLDDYKKNLEKREAELRSELRKINNEIELSFNPFKKHKYRLLSILIHDGWAESGHYFSFIYDLENQIWRRYNDIAITVESEEVVLSEAFGGMGNISAYCLIYVKENTFFPEKLNNGIRNYETSETRNQDDYYTKEVRRTPLYAEVNMENMKFAEEVQDFIQANLVRKIIDEYLNKLEKTNDYAKRHFSKRSPGEEAKNSPPGLLNFCVFLKTSYKNQNNSFDKYVKGHLLDITLRELHPEKIKLEDLREAHPMFQDKLKDQLSKLSSAQKPENLQKHDEFQQLIAEYIDNVQCAEICNYIFEQLMKETEDYPIIFYGLDYVMSLHKPIDYFSKLPKDVFRVLMLKLCSNLLEWAFKKKHNEIFKLTEMLVGYLKKYANKDDHIQTQVKFMLGELVTTCLEVKMPDKEVKALQETIAKLNNGDLGLEFSKYFDLECKEIDERMNNIFEKNDPYKYLTHIKEDHLINRLRENFELFRKKNQKWIKLLDHVLKKKEKVNRDERQKQFEVS